MRSVQELETANADDRRQIALLRGQIDALESDAAGRSAVTQALRRQVSDLRGHAGLVAMHGPGVLVTLRDGVPGPVPGGLAGGYVVYFQDVQDVMVIDASGLSVLDLQDALNNLLVGGAEAIDVNQRRVVTGVPIAQTDGGAAVDGSVVAAPWRFTAIGDVNRLVTVADLMTHQLRADRRVREATYRVEANVVIRSVVTAKPFVYAIAS